MCGHLTNTSSYCRAAFASFLEDADVKRLLVFLDGKDLGVVS